MQTHSQSKKTMIVATTPFTFHSRVIHGHLKNVLDYSERKLNMMIEASTNNDVTTTLVMIYNDYCAGNATIAWHHGVPVVVPITKEHK
jgi:hypothetical protein